VSSIVSSVRSSQAERDRWAAAASLRGLSFNSWAVRALDEAAALEEALFRQEGATQSTEEGVTA